MPVRALKSYRRRRRYFLDHHTPEWDALWSRVRDILLRRGLDSDIWLNAMLYLGTWDGVHHFASDPDRAPGGEEFTFEFPVDTTTAGD